MTITPDDVLTLTGVAVDTATIAQAQGIIELAVSVDLSDLDVFAAGNRAWLRKAIAYQAAWLPSQVDLFSRADLTTVSQDGANYTFRDAEAQILAPLARKALSRVSWARTRTVYIRPGRQSYLGGSRPALPRLWPYVGQDDTDLEGRGWMQIS